VLAPSKASDAGGPVKGAAGRMTGRLRFRGPLPEWRVIRPEKSMALRSRR
jgi:hypothetical protein